MINIDVVYALPKDTTQIALQVENGTTVLEALKQSTILTKCQIDLNQHAVGIYGKLVSLDDEVQSGDRIEIYRPLLADPKAIRKRRAQEQK